MDHVKLLFDGRKKAPPTEVSEAYWLLLNVGVSGLNGLFDGVEGSHGDPLDSDNEVPCLWTDSDQLHAGLIVSAWTAVLDVLRLGDIPKILDQVVARVPVYVIYGHREVNLKGAVMETPYDSVGQPLATLVGQNPVPILSEIPEVLASP